MPNDNDLLKYYIEHSDKRFDALDEKIEKLISFRWLLIGASYGNQRSCFCGVSSCAVFIGEQMKNINVVNLSGSAAVSQTGEVISGSQLFAASAQAVVTGTSTGTLKFQFSNDVLPLGSGSEDPTNWSDISGATVAIAGAGVYAIPKFDVCYANIRTVFVFGNAAAGTILVTVCRGGGLTL